MKLTLPTNYVDDIPNPSVEGMRRYQMIYNSDNTVSFKDVTPYDQTGSDFGAGDINLTNEAVNQSADAGKIIDDPDTAEATTEEGYIAGVQLFNHVNQSLTAEDLLKFQFATDGEGNYGYLGADDSFVPFRGKVVYAGCQTINPNSYREFTCGFKPNYAIINLNYISADKFISIFVDFTTNTATRYYQIYNQSATVIDFSAYMNYFKQTSNGIEIKAIDNDYWQYTTVFLA